MVEPGAVDPAPGLENARSVHGAVNNGSALVDRNSPADLSVRRRLQIAGQ
jgi:hypothetical protein